MAARKSKQKPARKKAPRKPPRTRQPKKTARKSKPLARKIKAAARKPKKTARKPARNVKPAPRQAKALPYRRGVGIALINRKGEVFVAERFDMPGAWQMPQGGIDKGETPRQAALRELKEETGTGKARILDVTSGWLRYDLPKDIQRRAWKGKYRGQEQKWFLMHFTGRDELIDISGGGAHREFARWKWLPFRDLPRVIVGFKRDIYKKVVAAFAARAESHGRAAKEP